jgi:RNA polymerase sigma-70 factor (ECF subfamily)
MLGSPADADDALQETLLAAWRGLATFEGRSSLRTWLYQVSTHACLRLGSRRPARLLSSDHGPPRHGTADLGDPVAGAVWLEPFADEQAHDQTDITDDPATRYFRRETVELAFVAALQHLPGTQRAALLLCDVLEFSAAEAAAILDTTTASLNSALQRARKAVEERVPPMSQQAELRALGDEGQNALVASFVTAWEHADMNAMVRLLTEDARFTMPPLPAWFDGRAFALMFFAERVFQTPWRLQPLRGNGQAGFACYMQQPGADRFTPGGLVLLRLRGGLIASIDSFIDPAVCRRFGMPDELG